MNCCALTQRIIQYICLLSTFDEFNNIMYNVISLLEDFQLEELNALRC